MDSLVNCIKLVNQAAGSNSMYNESSRVTTMVTTNGTLKLISRLFKNFTEKRVSQF